MKARSKESCCRNSSYALLGGILFATIHIIWLVMVATNVAHLYLNWILRLHFVSNPFWIQPFHLTGALTLVAFTFIMGYIGGWLVGFILHLVRK